MRSSRNWQAVVARDKRADGRFVYAVATTGVYCRPSCPSRKPRRENVEFFDAAVAAEAAGYRACRRCKPAYGVAPVLDVERVRRASHAVMAAPTGSWTIARVAAAAGSSATQIRRAFRSVLRMSPRDYVAACRRRAFQQKLRTGASVTDAIYESGYGSSSPVYEVAATPGMTPATYARRGRGARIEWTTAASPVGTVLVGATARGVCFVAIGHTAEPLANALGQEFPEAEIAHAPTSRLRALASSVAALAAAEPIVDELPVDIRGTAFQWRVWRALTRIPAGQTKTYAQVAQSIGAPASVRAVARACATNPISLVVPCHRVIGTNGSLTGYRWGIDVKHALLDAERVGSNSKRRA